MTSRFHLYILVSVFSVSYVKIGYGESGVELGVSLTGEYAARLIKPDAPTPRTEHRTVLSLPVSLDTAKLFKIDLGTITAQGLFIKEDAHMARGISLVDDVHAYSNLKAEDRLQLFELYWEHDWGRWLTRIGKLDANDHFAVSEHEAYLINGASGFSPSIFGLPSYPDSAWSAQLAYRLPRFDILAGVFDGGSTTRSPTPTGSRMWLSPSAQSGKLFWVAQVTTHLGTIDPQLNTTATPEDRLRPQQSDRGFRARAPLHLTLGVWTHQGEVLPPPTEQTSNGSSGGVYLTGDVEVTRFSHGGEVGLGFQVAMSPAYFPLHASVALTIDDLTAPLLWGDHGLKAALGVSHIGIDEGAQGFGLGSSSEELVELSLTLPITPHMLFGLTGMSILMEREVAHLIVSRLTIGAL